ncbi:MAG TPA: YceI family protein [Gemmataceae bacterium]|jgi:polyisoprenoid-binding protein YceI|nr:YceI family protein [Gemmataceae bacterium]
MRARSLVAAALFLGLAGAAAPARAADTFKVDPVHSSLLFRIKHLNVGYIYGRFNAFGGTFAFDKDPAACNLTFEVNIDSLDTANADRDKHLKGPDFFNVKQFATAGFKSKSFKAVDEKTYEVSGDLTLHGVTQPVTVKLERVGTAKGMRGEVRTGIDTTFTIKRSDFGMKYGLQLLSDEVRITVAVEGIQQ